MIFDAGNPRRADEAGIAAEGCKLDRRLLVLVADREGVSPQSPRRVNFNLSCNTGNRLRD